MFLFVALLNYTLSQPASSQKPEGAGIVETSDVPEGQSESRLSGRNSETAQQPEAGKRNEV